MDWLFLSPHYDDIALSCAGLVWDRVVQGDRASVWTICAGEVPPGSLSPFAESLHARWETGSQAVDRRRSEDIASCGAMNAGYLHLELPDCIYRGGPAHFYASEEAIFGEVHPQEDQLIHNLSNRLKGMLPPEAQVVCPLALGGHVDHRLTRRAAEEMGCALWYYPDYPYVLKNTAQLAEMTRQGWKRKEWTISPDGIAQWKASVAAHISQISTFWPDLPSMQQAIEGYACQFGLNLWQKPT